MCDSKAFGAAEQYISLITRNCYFLRYECASPSKLKEHTTYWEIESTQGLLSKLRGAAEAITNLRPGSTLEDYFKGSIVCHMDNRILSNSNYSVTGCPVVVKHLATTRTALALAESLNQPYPLPGLDDIQMDKFIDISNRMCDLQKLHRCEVKPVYSICFTYLTTLCSKPSSSPRFAVRIILASFSIGISMPFVSRAWIPSPKLKI